jgi:hypothetical protein
VKLWPWCQLNKVQSSTLTDMIRRVISVVQACGFIVVIVASDNNQINAKAFEQLCGSDDMSLGITNPNFITIQIFFIFDTVHILKCIRNNWLNQKDSEQTFIYPQPCPVYRPSDSDTSVDSSSTGLSSNSPSSTDMSVQTHSSSGAVIEPKAEQSHLQSQLVTVFMPVLLNGAAVTMPVVVPLQVMSSTRDLPSECSDVNNNSELCVQPSTQLCSGKASVSKLKAQYENEKNVLLKEAPRLKYKMLYPTNIERQKVSLVLGIFNEKTVEALASKCDENSKETSTFINIIVSCWKIMNVKSLYKGSRLRDELSKPFTSPDDARVKFFKEFVKWLTVWSDSRENEKSGCLSKPTLRALIQTTRTMCNIISYVHLTLGFDYFLTGKVQTDNLERRFGLYRQLCGANYHVSVVQVLEAEKSLGCLRCLPCAHQSMEL